MRNRDSLLHQLVDRPLAKPCDATWELMRGDEKIRRCDSCERDVYAISAMTEQEAELRLLNATDAVPCIRYHRDSDGNVVHAPLVVRSAYAPSHRAALVVATALGATMIGHDATAKEKAAASEASQCVPYDTQAAPAPAAPAGGAASSRAPAPAPAAPAPPPQQPLGGAPMIPERPVASGTLVVHSKIARTLHIGAVTLEAPVVGYRMTPGDFTAEVTEAGKKPRTVKLKIKIDKVTTVELD